MTILMQKDVADKILRQYHHKKPKSSVLSLFLAKKSDLKKICDVPASCFDPAPKVDSTVLQFEANLKYPDLDGEAFLEFIKKAFSEPRKKLISNLIKGGYQKEKIIEIFTSLSIPEQVRPEDINIDMYCLLLKRIL